MEDPNKFEITTYLVEELERKVLRSFSNEEDDFYMQKFYGPFDPIVLDRKIQGPMLDYFIKYIYTRTEPLNATEINKWLIISLNQFKTHSPEQRKEPLREAYFQVYYFGTYMTRKPTETDNHVNKFFELIFESYKRNFHLFQNVTLQALDDLKKGYLGSFVKVANQDFQESKKKIKTNLSVPQLAYLFKVLKEVGIITNNENNEIYNVLEQNFSSKQREDISINTLKNDFEAPAYATIEFWREKFMLLVQKARKDKEK